MLYYSILDLEKTIPSSRDSLYTIVKSFSNIGQKYNLKADIRLSQGYFFYKKAFTTNSESSRAFKETYYSFLEKVILHLMTTAYDRALEGCPGNWSDTKKQQYALGRSRRIVNEFYFSLKQA